MMTTPRATTAGVTLYWLPLGAGGHCIARNGRIFEALMATYERRTARDLYHSALEVHLGDARFVIEMTPVWAGAAADRGVVAVASPRRVSSDLDRAQEVLELVPSVPALTWGRDESRTGEMWNSNSLTSWLLARSNHPMDTIDPPAHGRAPGWHAGLALAGRQATVAGGRPREPA